ncbi:MAG TPA: transglutaminase-like domain-containing protein [Candidatus Limnocylindrales bacterium]|nr:transglutaminase-like domain-containing protein [Candidatus Limnocylindrales bacterium]
MKQLTGLFIYYLSVIMVPLVSFLVITGSKAEASNSTSDLKPKQASFAIKNEFVIQVPPEAKVVRAWFTVPQEDAYSEIKDFLVESDYPVQYHKDSQGNKVGYLEVQAPQQKEIVIRERFSLTRTEIRNNLQPTATRPLNEKEHVELAEYLKPATHIIINDQIKALARQIAGDEENPVIIARKLYDWTIENIDYWVKDPDNLKASAFGDTEYCLTTKTGNCTDFHSLYASLGRSLGIPVQLVYGSLLKPTLNGVEVDGSYHCWVEFYAPNLGWIPLDAAIADIYAGDIKLTEKNAKLVELTTAIGYHGPDPNIVNYYFGNLDERRVVWSKGRDLIMSPPQDGGPVNALSKIYVEVDGKEYKDWTRLFTYQELNKNSQN